MPHMVGASDGVAASAASFSEEAIREGGGGECKWELKTLILLLVLSLDASRLAAMVALILFPYFLFLSLCQWVNKLFVVRKNAVVAFLAKGSSVIQVYLEYFFLRQLSPLKINKIIFLLIIIFFYFLFFSHLTHILCHHFLFFTY